MNDGTGTGWDETAPDDDDFEYAGPQEIRDLRKAFRIREAHEHTTPAADSVGGEHLTGSAKAYCGTDYPTNKPSGSPLGNEDLGRLFVNQASGQLSYYTGGWYLTVTTDPRQIANRIITGSHIALNTILGENILDGSIASGKLTSVDGAIILDGTVTDDKIDSMDGSKLVAASVPESALAAGVLGKTGMSGGYTGNGTTTGTTQTITLGWRPCRVEIGDPTNNNLVVGIDPGNNSPARLRFPGAFLADFNLPTAITFSDTGFTVTGNNATFNANGTAYLYVAIKQNP